MDGLAGSPLMPLMGATVALVVLIALVVVVFIKLRSATRQESKPQRLSEEAFAAAMIQSALAGRPAPTAVVTSVPGPAAAIPAGDAALMDALPVAVIAIDGAGVVRRVNPAARAELGLDAAATGHPFRTVLAPWPELVDAIARTQAASAQASGSTLAVEVGGLAGGPRQARVARWSSGGPRGGVVTIIGPGASEAAASPLPGFSDVSKLAGGLAHELANSLTTIHGYAHLVNQAALSEADRSAMEQIKASGEAMLATIDAFRSLVRPLRLSTEPFPPEHAGADAVSLALQETKAAAEAVRVTTAPCQPVMGDRVVIEEAIAAVVQNAIEAQAHDPAAAPVTVGVAPAASGGADVVVTDHGPGVLPELRARLCQPFFSDKVGHPGLGLARACHVLRAHQGASIAFDHPPTGGLVVTIHLPPAA